MPKNDIKLTTVPIEELAELRRIAAGEMREAERVEGESRTTLGNNRAKSKASDQIRFQPVLMPWMLVYAEWLTCECLRPPTRSARTAKAGALSRAPINDGLLRVLEARLDFTAYTRELERGPLERARAKFINAFPEYVEAHRDALNMAREAKDFRAMAQITEPVLDRVVPKRAEAVAATQVTITLTPEQARSVAVYAAPPLLVAEAIPELVVDEAPSGEQ